MPDLMDCQRDLAGALNDKRESARAMRWLAGDASLTERRLAIYRANVEAAANKALSAAYPVIRQVVGGARFDDLARAYQRHAPSRSGDLNELGSAFTDFIADNDGARSLPYLPDLARLEWAAHRAYGAADAEALDADALAQLPVHRQSMIRFSWAAGTALIAISNRADLVHPSSRLRRRVRRRLVVRRSRADRARRLARRGARGEHRRGRLRRRQPGRRELWCRR